MQVSGKVVRLRPVWVVVANGAANSPAVDNRTRNVAFTDISLARIQAEAPDAILAPLITPEFDLLDLAEVLVSCGFRKSLVALSRPLPSANMILREINALYPNLDVRIAELPEALEELQRQHP